VSFEAPEYTANSDALGTLRILEAVRMLGLTKKTSIYQASTSELYGLVQEIAQKESSGMVACNGVLFNHESPRRGDSFVTRKITRGLPTASP